VTSGTYSSPQGSGKRSFSRCHGKRNTRQGDPDFFSVDGWDGMASDICLGQGNQGQIHADEALAFLSTGKDPNSPRGPIMIDPETRDIVQNIYIRRVEKQGDALVNVEIATSRWSRIRGRS